MPAGADALATDELVGCEIWRKRRKVRPSGSVGVYAQLSSKPERELVSPAFAQTGAAGGPQQPTGDEAEMPGDGEPEVPDARW
jgi:hypothetical protein